MTHAPARVTSQVGNPRMFLASRLFYAKPGRKQGHLAMFLARLLGQDSVTVIDVMESRLRFERIKRGWTQRQLGDLARVRQVDVSFIETGRLRPTEEQLRRLARALGISPPDVLLRPVKVVLEEVEG